jgi:hypothetical protein
MKGKPNKKAQMRTPYIDPILKQNLVGGRVGKVMIARRNDRIQRAIMDFLTLDMLLNTKIIVRLRHPEWYCSTPLAHRLNCILCQKESGQPVLKCTESSFKNLLPYLRQWDKYDSQKYPLASELTDETVKSLVDQNARYHRE